MLVELQPIYVKWKLYKMYEEKHALIVYQVEVHKDDILTRDDQAAICPPVDGLTQGPFTVFFKIV